MQTQTHPRRQLCVTTDNYKQPEHTAIKGLMKSSATLSEQEILCISDKHDIMQVMTANISKHTYIYQVSFDLHNTV